MPSSDKHKITFIHIPKNAGTSVSEYFEMDSFLGHHHWGYYRNKKYRKIAIVRNPWDRFVSCYEYARMEKSYYHAADGKALHGRHVDYLTLKDRTFEECVELAKGSYLGFYKNQFKDGAVLNMTYPQILKHQGWLPQTYWIYGIPNYGDKLMVDDVIKQEEIDHPERGLSSILDTGQPVPQINASTRKKDYREYYNKETKQSVASIYSEDIEKFSYEF